MSHLQKQSAGLVELQDQAQGLSFLKAMTTPTTQQDEDKRFTKQKSFFRSSLPCGHHFSVRQAEEPAHVRSGPDEHFLVHYRRSSVSYHRSELSK